MEKSGTTRPGPKRNIRYVVWLSGAEREQLERLLKVGKVAAYKRRHAEVLLKADEGELGPAWTDLRTAEAVGVTPVTVRNVRRRFVELGLEAVLNRKKQVRPSRQVVLDGEKEAKLIAIACGQRPAGQARWTLKLLAGRLVQLKIVPSVALETVRKTLKKRIAALAQRVLVHPARRKCRVRLLHGNSARRLPTTVRLAGAVSVLRRASGATDRRGDPAAAGRTGHARALWAA